MAGHSNYQRNDTRQFYPSLASINSADHGHLYTRNMGPPSSDYPRPVEIDLNPRTLPNPAASAPIPWDAASFTPSGFGDMTYGSNISRVSTIVHDSHSHSRGTAGDPLVQWYQGNDGPWNPFTKVVGEAEDRSLFRQTSHRNTSQYTGQYRHQHATDPVSMQYGVPHSDSGYGTRRSVGNTSVFSADVQEREHDAQSLLGPATDFPTYPGFNEVLQRDTRISGSWTPPSAQLPDSPGLVCPDCHKPVKTQSELKKHDLRHRKPFTCTVPGCSRKEGFSTTNDLDRHTKSLHPTTTPENLSVKKFRCHVPGCKSKDKAWPRLDNFRSHLKRVHSNHLRCEDDFDDMIKRAEFFESTGVTLDQEISLTPQRQQTFESRPPSLAVQESMPSKRVDQDWKLPYPEVVGRSEDSVSPKSYVSKVSIPEEHSPQFEEPQPATVQPLEVFPAPAEILSTRITLASLVLPPTHNIDPSLHDSEHTRPSRMLPRVSLQVKAPKPNPVSAADVTLTEVIQKALAGASISDLSPEHSRDSERSSLPSSRITSTAWPLNTNVATSNRADPNDAANKPDAPSAEHLKKAAEVLKIIRDLGFIVSKDPAHASKLQNPGSAASNKSENQVTCQQCKRFRGRPCELRKHMKRHERPYGCTFPTCSKTFGSKNDWKRHENSQHFHLETWRCDVTNLAGTTCAKVCYRRQTFQEHLTKSHQMSDDAEVKKKVDGCRIGRNCQARFWCGFCVKLVDLRKRGLEAWTERFDHIDDHFMGRDMPEMRIVDWIPVDGDKPKGDAESPHALSPEKDDGHDGAPSASGRSTATAIVLDAATSHPKRTRTSSSEDEPRPSKQAKKSQNYLIFCCQCNEQHNYRINQNCMNCSDQHRFCKGCKTEIVPAD